MKNIYSYRMYCCLLTVFVLGSIFTHDKLKLSLKLRDFNTQYRFAGIPIKKNPENDSLIKAKEISSHKIYTKNKVVETKKITIPPSPSDLNRAEAVPIDKYIPVLFVFAIIFIIYYVRNNEKKNNP